MEENERGAAGMTIAHLTPEQTSRALQIWADYQQQHDLSDRLGQAAGIEPMRGIA